MSAWFGSWGWAPRKSVADRRADAERHIADAARRGKAMSPVRVSGRAIAHTFWGKAWCDNLERYRDFAYRLERGRSYLRSGSVIDLRITAGKIAAQVSGSELYDVAIRIDAVAPAAWRAIRRDCAGGIASRIDLLAGELSEPVMARLCADRTGLFPAPSGIQFSCSCPDYASMCKHVAAVMYGVGARLDHAPELLFTLRRVALEDLVSAAVTELPAAPAAARILAQDGLAALFGLDLDTAAASVPARGGKRPVRAAPAGRTARTASATPEPAPRSTRTAKATRAALGEPRRGKPPREAMAVPRQTAVSAARSRQRAPVLAAAPPAATTRSSRRAAAARAAEIVSRRPARPEAPGVRGADTRRARSGKRADAKDSAPARARARRRATVRR